MPVKAAELLLVRPAHIGLGRPPAVAEGGGPHRLDQGLGERPLRAIGRRGHRAGREAAVRAAGPARRVRRQEAQQPRRPSRRGARFDVRPKLPMNRFSASRFISMPFSTFWRFISESRPGLVDLLLGARHAAGLCGRSGTGCPAARSGSARPSCRRRRLPAARGGVGAGQVSVCHSWFVALTLVLPMLLDSGVSSGATR